MSLRPPTGGRSGSDVAAFPARPAANQPPPSAAHRLDLIACAGCGRCFTTPDGPGMIAAIKGACPDCGGRFELTSGP